MSHELLKLPKRSIRQWPGTLSICYRVERHLRLGDQILGETRMASRQRKQSILATTIALVFAIATASSQETAATGSSNPATNGIATPTTDATGQAQAAFEKAFDAYKAAIRDIEKLQSEFQTADAAKRQQLNTTMTGQVAHAQTLMNGVVEAAIEAYRAAPNSNEQITDLLRAVARYYVVGRELPHSDGQIDGGDQYERALPIIKVLVEGGAGDQNLLLWGFLSAFATSDFDLAQQYLKQAQEAPPADEDAAPHSGAAESSTMELIAKLAPMIDEYRALWATELEIRAAEAAADDLPQVKLTTTKGEITLELFENEAPQSVANFLSLVKQGYYNGSPFHRVIAKFMAQGGAKNDDGSGELGYTIRDESAKPNHRIHFRGSLSMARQAHNRDSGGSQFFLTFVPTPHLNGQHTVFGRVIDGIEVLADLQRREHGNDPAANAALPKPDRILKAEVLRDRGHEYVFEKLPVR
jgi:cyclophilin family peptidyl-prolyl cis-trans isomerase